MSTLVFTVPARTAIVCVSLFVFGGCAYGELKQVLRAQVASETNCGEVIVETAPMYLPGYKPGQYRVTGCGVERTYECPKEDGLVSYGGQICRPAAAPAAAPPAAAAGLDADDPALGTPMEPEPSEPLEPE